MPSIPAAAVLSFLKDTRGALNWNLSDLIGTLKINASDARQVIAVLQIQGYIKAAHGNSEWITTSAGEEVSCSKPPRFTRQSIEQALAALGNRIKAVNQNPKSPFKISKAVAFGDFLSDRQRVQSPDVGIELVSNRPKSSNPTNLKFED